MPLIVACDSTCTLLRMAYVMIVEKQGCTGINLRLAVAYLNTLGTDYSGKTRLALLESIDLDLTVTVIFILVSIITWTR